MFDELRSAEAMASARKLEGIYHKGQAKIWSGKELLPELIRKHGGVKVPQGQQDALRAVFAIILWGELAAWKVSADLALHLAIGAASQNPMIRSVAGVIETALLEAFTLSPPTQAPALHHETVEAHARIVERIAARDEAGAAQAMLAVIDAGYQRVEAEQSPAR